MSEKIREAEVVEDSKKDIKGGLVVEDKTDDKEKKQQKWTVIAVVIICLVALAGVLVYMQENQENLGASIVLEEIEDVSSLPETTNDDGIDWSAYPSYEIELTESIQITKGGVYYLTGTLENGMITIDTDDEVKLVLNGVTIKNSSGPAIFVLDAESVTISTVKDTTNTLEDGSSYTLSADTDAEGAIYSKDDLYLEGEGTLVATGNKGDAIVSKDSLVIYSGTYEITAADDGIRGKDSLTIAGGDFTISAPNGQGIKSSNDEANEVSITGGTINITSSKEGIEAEVVNISGGEISIKASDDGINAASDTNCPSTVMGSNNTTCQINISGGSVYINASGDGVDSNGMISVSGGTLIVDGPTNSGNGALDYESNMTVTGGTIIAVGASGMAENISTTSTQYGIMFTTSTTYSAGAKIELVDESGNTVLSHTAAKSFSSVVFSSPDIATGTYSLVIDDTTVSTQTVSSIVTGTGSGMGGFMQPGAQQNQQNSGSTQQPGGARGGMR